MRVTIALISNRPGVLYGQFLATAEHIKPLADYGVRISMYLQKPFTVQDAKTVKQSLRDIGFQNQDVHVRIRDTWRDSSGLPFLTFLREKSCQYAGSDTDAFLILDDDTRFSPGTPKYPRSSGVRYLEAIDYLERFPQCGVLLCTHSLGGYTWGYRIRPVLHAHYGTQCGMFLRKIPDQPWYFAPRNYTLLAGGGTEVAACYPRLALGYYAAKQMNNPTNHRPTQMVRKIRAGKYEPRTENPIHANPKAGEHVLEYWPDSTWHVGCSRIPYTLACEFYTECPIDERDLFHTDRYIGEY